MKVTVSLAVIAALIGASVPARAHHGSTPHFDPEDPVTLQGVVTDLRFVNPHAFVYFDVTDENGDVAEWRCELSGATTLRRLGWTPETLVPGQAMEISGTRARREDNACLMSAITLADGTAISNETIRRFGVLPVADSGGISERPRYLANGQPNISGAWISRSGGGAGGELSNGPAEPTPAGLAAAETFDARYDNPVIRCESGNIISDWYRQSQISDIRQFDDRIVMRYGYLDMNRTIYLDAEHPDELVPSVTGHSVGTWDGNVLVVDTIGLAERVLIPLSAIMTSDQAHIVERFRFDAEEGALIRDYVVTDPLYLQRPYGARNISDIASEPYQPFNCVDLSGDNNRRPD